LASDPPVSGLRYADAHGARWAGLAAPGTLWEHVGLGRADLTGADLRGARLAGADLRGSLFLTQAQLDAATGDADTRVPAALTRPRHWA
jgi:uncharacterized protein YjbI with pentapeptide repeats